MTETSLDRLYSASRAAFVDVRQRLVQELKAAGRKDEAAEVAKAQKPTVAAWALNQLARRQGDLLKRLGRAGAKLRRVQLPGGSAGGDRQAFSDAVTAQRAALAEARAAAEALLREEGSAVPVHLLESILRSLRGGAASEEAQAALEAGRFAREPDAQDLSLLASGAVFGIDEPASPPRSSAKTPPAKPAGRESSGKPPAAEAREAKAAAEAAARAHAHAAAERAVKNLSAALDKAVGLQKQRERDVAEARGALAAAEARFAAAKSAADTARLALAEAERHRRETS